MVDLNFVFEQYGAYFAVLGSQGDRLEMEDTFTTFSSLPGVEIPNLFAVFDGHGGKRCATYAKEALPQTIAKHPELKRDAKKAIVESFLEVDKQYCKLAQKMKNMDDGTTATVLYVTPVLDTTKDSSPQKKRLKFWLAAVGDSRALLVMKDGSVYPLSKDHDLKRQDETNRILEAGGRVKRDDFGARVVSDTVGELAVTRAIGDLDFKRIGVTAEPEIMEGFLDDTCAFIVMASDGLWNQITNDECGSLLVKSEKFPPGTKLATMLEELIKLAKTRDNQLSHRFREDLSCDNITVMGVNIPAMIEKLNKKCDSVHGSQSKLREKSKRKQTLRIKGLSPYGYTAELLLWKNPLRSALWVLVGSLFYFLVEVGGYSSLTLVSYLLIAQLLVDSIVVNFTPLLRKIKIVDDDFDSTVFLNEGRFFTDEVVDRGASLAQQLWTNVADTWKTVVYDASPNNVLLAMRNISYCFTPFNISTLLFITFLSCFSLFVTYERNKDILDRLYNSFMTKYFNFTKQIGLR